MKTGILSMLMLVVLGLGFVQSGNYGASASRKPKPPSTTRRQVQVLAETPEYRRIRHAFGETEVVRTPRRIVSLSSAATDSLVTLGVRPVLVESAWKSSAPAPYLAAGLEGVPAVRRAGGIPLESILEARPDLILIQGNQDGRMYGQLSKIAPTVALGVSLSDSAEDKLSDVGRILGLTAHVEARVAAYREKLARTRATLAACAADEPVVFLRFRQRTCVVYAQAVMFGPLLFEGLGLVPDAAMPMTMPPGGWDVLSLERLSKLRPAHVFAVVDPDSTSYYAYVTATPIWQRIPAVKSGRVHAVATTTWIFGEGVLANEAIMRDVLAAMAREGRP